MMWRYLLSGVAVLLVGAAALFFFRAPASSKPILPAAPKASNLGDDPASENRLPDEAPSATLRTREEKRFDRYDKDHNETITRDEYLLSRRKAFAKLDGNGDGRLSFDEWVVKTSTKFATADGDRSGTLTRTEFVTTAPKRKAKKPACACKPAAGASDD